MELYCEARGEAVQGAELLAQSMHPLSHSTRWLILKIIILQLIPLYVYYYMTSFLTCHIVVEIIGMIPLLSLRLWGAPFHLFYITILSNLEGSVGFPVQLIGNDLWNGGRRGFWPLVFKIHIFTDISSMIGFKLVAILFKFIYQRLVYRIQS